MRNIVIFGGSGFIGSHYARHITDNFPDFRIESFDIKPNEYSSFLDTRDIFRIEGQYYQEDIIINLAAIHRMPGHEDYEYFETNIKGAENVCNFAEEKGIKNIIFTSSIAPYGAGEELKKETSLPVPNTPYGISKLIAEHIHRTWQAKDAKNRKLLVIRPGVVYGKGENGNNTRLYNAIKSRRFFYPGRKNTIKANIYVKDLVELSLEIFASYSSGTKLYNFAYEPGHTIEEIVNTMSEVCNLKTPKLVINGRLLKIIAKAVNLISVGTLGIHPQRIDKLMKSTNISGRKIIDDGFQFNYNLKSSIEDWFKDCDSEGLF